MTYYGHKLNHKDKSKEDTKLEIIKVATQETRKYSEKIRSKGENKDLINFIIYDLPIKVYEISRQAEIVEAKVRSFTTKRRLLTAINILILCFQIYFFFILNSQPIFEATLWVVLSFAIILLVLASAHITIPLLKDIRDLLRKHQQLEDIFGKAKDANLIELQNREYLVEFIRQRNKIGYGISLTSIKEELELYGLKVSDSVILRSHFDFLFSANPEDRREILSVFFLDGKTHESFDELSDKEIVEFLDTVKKNIENKPRAIRSFLNLCYPNPEEKRDILNIYFMDGKPHEDFDEISDEDALNFIETVKKNIEALKAQENENVS